MGTTFTTALAAAVLLLAVACAVEQLSRLPRGQQKAATADELRTSPLPALAGAATLAYAFNIDASGVLMAAASLGTGTSCFCWLYPRRGRVSPRTPQPPVAHGDHHE